MRLIDADKFLSYLIFSKHIDRLTCGEVKEAVEMCKVDVLEQIREEIEQVEINGHIKDVECFRAGINVALNVIGKYTTEGSDKECGNDV